MTSGSGGGGRDELFASLYRKYYRRVYVFFIRFRVADEDAQDLAQETFTRIFKAFGTYRREAEWSFVETTARHVLSNWIRGRNAAKRSAKTIDFDDPDFKNNEPAAPEGPDLAERQETAMQRAKLWAAIKDLPEGQRQCIELWMSGLEYRGIARALGITVDAVKSRIRDAKRTLSERLGVAFPEEEE